MIEDRKPRYQAPQQRRRAGFVRMGSAKSLLEEQSVDPRDERVAEADDLSERRREKVALSAVLVLARPHREFPQRSYATKESCLVAQFYSKITVVQTAQCDNVEYLQIRGKACNLAVSEFVTDD